MTRGHRWRDVPGELIVELFYRDTAAGLRCAHTDNEAPLCLMSTFSTLLDANLVTSDDRLELVIKFVSTGFYDPGSMYGGPDNLGSPPEGEDECMLDIAYFLIDGGAKVYLDRHQQLESFEHYSDAIEIASIETTTTREDQ